MNDVLCGLRRHAVLVDVAIAVLVVALDTAVTLVRWLRCFQDAFGVGQVVLAVSFEGVDEDGLEQPVQA